MDLEPTPKDSAAHCDNFTLGGEIIPDGRGDRGNARASADSASRCVALPDDHRVCEARVSLWVGASLLLVHPKATEAALYRFKNLFRHGRAADSRGGKASDLGRVQH
jgi:hypothetical protein